MHRFSSSLISSVSKNIKKECILKTKSIPNDQLILHLLKLACLNPSLIIKEEGDAKRISDSLINTVVNTLSRTNSMITINIQIYFEENMKDRENILENRQKNIKHGTDPLFEHILKKSINKNKEDTDQLYHLICCYIILTSGVGDPTDDEILKETMVALKSILSSKELIRFAFKSSSVKEKQLVDICSIVIGIKAYNKDGARKCEGDDNLFSSLEKALQKCNNFLDCKLREMEDFSWSLIHACVYYNFQRNSVSFEEDEKNMKEITQNIKSYLILLQQMTIYYRLLCQESNSLNEEFLSAYLLLEQRLTRIRKTVKSRTAIPVVEIYPQFKDISLSWNKIQEISALLNHLSNIVFDIWKQFNGASKPILDNLPSKFDFDSLKNSKQPKDVILNENSSCQLIKAEVDENFSSLNVEHSGFCIVTFFKENGVLVLGIKEYGLIKYDSKYYCFSSVENLNLFCQNPDMCIDRVKKLIFSWLDAITLLNMEKILEKEKKEKEITNQREKSHFADAEVQTDVHPMPSFKDFSHSSGVWQLQQKVIHLADLKNCRTHSVQTNLSNFRKESSTQTDKVRRYK